MGKTIKVWGTPRPPPFLGPYLLDPPSLLPMTRSHLCAHMCHTDAADSHTASRSAPAADLNTLTAWPGVEDGGEGSGGGRVLLAPHEVRTTWRDFLSASNLVIQQVRVYKQCVSV